MRFMRSFRSILKSIGTATAANLIGRAANVEGLGLEEGTVEALLGG